MTASLGPKTMPKRTKKLKQLRAGQAFPGMEVLWLSSLNLPPEPTTITRVGEVQKGHFMDFQDVYFRHPKFGREEHETALTAGCERLLVRSK